MYASDCLHVLVCVCKCACVSMNVCVRMSYQAATDRNTPSLTLAITTEETPPWRGRGRKNEGERDKEKEWSFGLCGNNLCQCGISKKWRK